MRFSGFVLTKKGQALLAKVQGGETLTFTKAATGAGQPPPNDAPFMATADLGVATIVRSENGAAGAVDVNTGFDITEIQPGSGTTAAVTEVEPLAAAELSGGEYFVLESPAIAFHVWFRVAGSGDDPAPENSVGIRVDVAALDSALTVAQKLATALDQYRLEMSDMYALIDQRQELAIQSVTRVDDVVSEILTVLTNDGLATGYYLCELGIFATDPDDGEILYALANAGTAGDYFPAEGGSTLIEAELRMRTIIAADAVLSMSVSPGVYASLSVFMADKQGRAWKEPVRAASTEDITLSGTQTVDGVALTAMDRVLVKDQSDATENGIYSVAAGEWARAEDADSDEKIRPGMLVPVAEGDANADSLWVLATDGIIELGTTNLTFINSNHQAIPYGAEMLWPTETVPDGWLEEDGSSLTRAAYPELFAVIGTLYGTADGDHFNLPDARGAFPRAWNHGAGVDPDAASRTAPTAPGATISAGDHVGTQQLDLLKSHTHNFNVTATALSGGTAYEPIGGSGGVLTAATGGNETRPVNTARMMIMRAY